MNRLWYVARGLLATALLVPGVAVADTYAHCTKTEAATIARAVSDAKRIALTAAAAVGDTPEFETWFGKHDAEIAETVRRNLKAVVSAIRTGAVSTTCENVSRHGCEQGIYAYVYDDEPYLVHICPPFFELPNMARLQPGQRNSNFGTRAGTIVHEISHFAVVADTDDNCYARDVCAEMAQDDPWRAVRNADSYQYYVEDVTYFRPDSVAVKPPRPVAAGGDN